jgi:H+/Cl- antiporter ClcA
MVEAPRREVDSMPTDVVTENGKASDTATRTRREDELRTIARKHVERIRRLKLHVSAYVVGMIVLTPVWALTQWQTSGGFQRWSSDHSQPGDWEPWILPVALVWGLIVAIYALKVYFERPATDAEIDRELRRLR